ncbi:MAG: hypothetical protein KC609_10030 [Myxococcales bacterium]|nr:hypothetical protein [Myxococcales bacterium]
MIGKTHWWLSMSLSLALTILAGILVFGCAKGNNKTSSNDSVNGTDVVVVEDTADATESDVSEADQNQTDTSGELLPFGAECKSNKVCESALCVPADPVGAGGTVYVCSKKCLQECPNGWVCKVIVLGADTLTVCLPDEANLCEVSQQCRYKDDEGNITQDQEVCGNCGVRKRNCQTNCQWGEWGSCEGEGACRFGETEEEACGKCGTRVRVCTDKCEWSAYGPCQNEKTCDPGQKEVRDCGTKCGKQERTCLNTCEWSDYGLCSGEGECTPLSVDVENCSQVQDVNDACRLRGRVCTSACTWGLWGACGLTVSGSTQTSTCGTGDVDEKIGGPDSKSSDPEEVSCWKSCGKWVRECNSSTCGWGEWKCVLPTLGDEKLRCQRTGETDPNKQNWKSEACGAKCGTRQLWCAEKDGTNDISQQPYKACTWVPDPTKVETYCDESQSSCQPGDDDIQDCGLCGQGTQTRSCLNNGTCGWGNWSTCSYANNATYTKACSEPGANANACWCVPGQSETRTSACSKCGFQTRICGSDCKWGAWSSCQNEGECVAGTTEQQTLPHLCEKQSRSCTSQCRWNNWVTSSKGVCDAGDKQSSKCTGQCGYQHRTCASSCQWGSWSGCDYVGSQCSPPGAFGNCDLCGTKTCSSSCTWGSCPEEQSKIDGYEPNNSSYYYVGSQSDCDNWKSLTAYLVPKGDTDRYQIQISDTFWCDVDPRVKLTHPESAVVMDVFYYKRGTSTLLATCYGVKSCNKNLGDDLDIFIRVYYNGSKGGSCTSYKLEWTG